jgi:hypothetical protein
MREMGAQMPLTVAAALDRYPGPVAFRYGDGPDLNAEIVVLVRAGCFAEDAPMLMESFEVVEGFT